MYYATREEADAARGSHKRQALTASHSKNENEVATVRFLLDSSDPVPALESYLDNLVADDARYVEQFSDGLSLSHKAAGIDGAGSDDLEETLLSYSLKMRVYSPLCELHSKLAYENINSSGEGMNSKRITHAVHRQRVVTSVLEPVHALETSNDAGKDVEILPHEAALGDGVSTIFLYSNFNSQEFREWHAHLQSLIRTYRLVYRYLGGGSIADETSKSKTYLQGYVCVGDIKVYYEDFEGLPIFFKVRHVRCP